MGHHQPTRTASDDCQLKHAPNNRMLRPEKMKRQAHTTKIVERLDQNVNLTHVGRAPRARFFLEVDQCLACYAYKVQHQYLGFLRLALSPYSHMMSEER
jgi:hypothetical protein